MKNFLLVCFITFSSVFAANAQIADGSIAPDFTVTDIDGNTHNLYSYLNAGKHVVLDFSATWCGPCWSYHNTGILESLWDNYGPNGSNEIMVIFIEADLGTNLACLYGTAGCVGGTQGNWVANTGYPIVNLTSTNGPNVANNYQIGYFPTLFAIDATDKRIFEIGQPGVTTWESWLFQSFGTTFTSSVQNSIPCAGSGEIALSVTSGMPSNFFDWNNGATTSTISGLTSGNYNCEISDANGFFINTPTYSIGGPTPISIETVSIQNNLCNGVGAGVIEISTSGGNGGFSYFWNNGSGSNYINNLFAGDYTVTVTDNQGCEKEATYTITEPAPLLGSETYTNPTCGLSNGSITLQVLGGASPYSYEMNGGTQSSPLFTNLPGGVYPYTIIDNNNCHYTSNVTLTSSELPLAMAATSGEVSCVNLTAEVNGTGSSSGSNFTYLWTTSDGTIVSGANALIATVSAGGTYNLLVTNTSSSCTKLSSTVVVGNNTKPSLVVENPAELNCVTSQVVIDASESSTGANFTYAWSTANGNILSGGNTLTPTVDEDGDYSLLITNTSNGCTKQASTSIVENIAIPSLEIPEVAITCENPIVELCAVTNAASVLWDIAENNNNNCISIDNGGTFSVTATGANGCTATMSSTVIEAVGIPQISVTSPSILTCVVETLSLNGQIVGDVAEYIFNWTTVDGTIDSGGNTLEPTVSDPGTYTFEATNILSGCSSHLSVVLTEIVAAPSSTFTGSTTVTGYEGVANAIANTNEYLWDFGNGTTSSEANGIAVYTASGIYDVCLTVSNDCGENVTCQKVTFSLALSVTSVIENVSCASGANGKIEVILTGGLAPFTYSWTGPNGYSSDKSLISNLGTGLYTVLVSDSNNNTFTQDYTITAPQELLGNAPVVVNDTNNQSQGSIDITISGGVSPYTFVWSNGAKTEDIAGLKTGEYTCIVTDKNGCEKTFGPYSVANTSGVDELKYISNFEVYPNPTRDMINFNIKFLNTTKSNVKIINNLGNVVSTKSYLTHINDSFDVSSLSSGIYFLSVSNEEFNIVKRFVVIK